MTATVVFNDFVAGWTSGIAGLLVSHPLDTVKVRIQSLPSYKGAMHCIIQTMREESPRGFYKGMSFPLLSAGFLHSLYFIGHSSTLALTGFRNHTENRRDNPFRMLILSSVVGSILQWIPSCPIENVKTKLQVQYEDVRRLHSYNQMRFPDHLSTVNGLDERRLFTGPLDCMRETVRLYGIRGLYRGGLTMLVRDVVGFCFYLPVYELILWRLASRYPRDHGFPIWTPILAGGVAGVASWWSILPLDVIKSRLQADDLTRPKYKGFWHCVSNTYSNEGLKAFAKGWHVLAIRGFPACACIFFVYEHSLNLLIYSEKSLSNR